MSYPSYLVEKVKAAYQTRQLLQKQKLDDRRQQIYRELPEIHEIDNQLQLLGLQFAKSFLTQKETKQAFSQMKKETKDLQAKKKEILKKNGYPVSYLEPSYACKLCNDTGYTADGKQCSCFADRLKEEAYLASNLPLVMDKQSFDTFRLDLYPDNDEEFSPRMIMGLILDACRGYAEDFGNAYENLLLYGGTGLGKTFLSSCIAKRVLEKGYSVFYQPAYKIFSVFEEYKFGSGDKTLSKAQTAHVYDTDLLIMDDLGTEMVTAYTAEVLFDLINTRLNAKKPTIINTNLGLSELETIYSPRITSRLIGSYTQLKFCGEDIRRMDTEED